MQESIVMDNPLTPDERAARLQRRKEECEEKERRRAAALATKSNPVMETNTAIFMAQEEELLRSQRINQTPASSFPNL